ncbi:MAG: Eco57I restriction-modification methylase domain-containing protein [Promethearchaeota archaeon]
MNDRYEFDLNSQLFKSFEEAVKAKNGEKVKDFLNLIKSQELSFLTSYRNRKSEGVYYTNEELSNFIVEKSILLFINKILERNFQYNIDLNDFDEINNLDLEIKKSIYDSLLKIKILDPACGAGVFLLSAANCLYDILKKNNSNMSDLDLRKTIINNLYGFDINEKAIKLCQLKLFSWVSISKSPEYNIITRLKSNIKIKNSVISSFKGKFDIIIGNPPYGNILSTKEKEILKKEGLFYKDIYCTFLLKALEWSNGLICFLIPKSFLLRQGYIHFRKELFSNMNIQKIYDLGPNLFKKATNEVQIIIYDKKNGINDNLDVYNYPKTKIITYKNQKFDELRACLNSHCSICVKSKKIFVYSFDYHCPYCNNDTIKLNRLRIKPTSKQLQIINKIEKLGNLNYLNVKDFPKMIRGEEDKGLAAIRKLIKNNLNYNCIFVNAKEDFSYYFIKKNKSFDLDRIDPSILKGKNYEYYENPRLLIKHNNIIPEAIFTKERMCFTSSIYSLLHDDTDELKYLCAVLNSKLIKFYCTYGINNQKGTTINLNQYMIRHLPIVKPSENLKKEIVERVDRIMRALEKNNGVYDNLILQMQNEIDNFLYTLYNIMENEIEIINSN